MPLHHVSYRSLLFSVSVSLKTWHSLLSFNYNVYYVLKTELDIGRVHPRVGLGRGQWVCVGHPGWYRTLHIIVKFTFGDLLIVMLIQV